MKTLISLCMAGLLSASAFAATVEEDVARYVKIFAGDKSQHVAAVESLMWMGISDERVFDPIERMILAEGVRPPANKAQKDEVAHYIRALGFSGQAKYAATIDKFAADSNYERHVKVALHDLPVYQKWNPIISNRASFDPKYGDDVNRVRNMLVSDDFLLKKIGAKRVFFSNKDEVLLELLAQEIRANASMNNRKYSDSMAWMVKALGSARQAKYRPLLEDIAANGGDRKAVDYARRALAD